MMIKDGKPTDVAGGIAWGCMGAPLMLVAVGLLGKLATLIFGG